VNIVTAARSFAIVDPKLLFNPYCDKSNGATHTRSLDLVCFKEESNNPVPFTPPRSFCCSALNIVIIRFSNDRKGSFIHKDRDDTSSLVARSKSGHKL